MEDRGIDRAAPPAPTSRLRPSPTCNTDSIHFIHIGKTGGSTIKRQVERLPGSRVVFHKDAVLGPHGFRLGQGAPGDCYAFFVRDPAERWVSGFMSRLRQGCPLYCWIGQAKEQWVFHNYPTPNALAEALYSEDLHAMEAVNSVMHMQHGFAWYLGDLAAHLQEVLFVGRVHNMEGDLEAFVQAAYGPGPALRRAQQELRRFHLHVHPNPDALAAFMNISNRARCNLERLLEADYAIMDTLHQAGLLQESYPRRCRPGQAEEEGSVPRFPPRPFMDAEQLRQRPQPMPVEQYRGCKHGRHTCEAMYQWILNGTLFA